MANWHPALGNLRFYKAAPIIPTIMDANFLEALENLKIPVRSSLPFAANWHSMVMKLLDADKGQAARWIATLIYEEWSFAFWHVTYGPDRLRELAFKAQVARAFESEVPRENWGPTGTSTDDIKDKWWIDLLPLKIRAVWDELPIAIAAGSSKVEFKAKKHFKRLNELSEKKGNLGLTPQGTQLLESFIYEGSDF